MDIRLTGKTALVTGGNSGIGCAISQALARAGADVAITYFSHDDRTGCKMDFPERKILYWRLDVTDSAAVNDVFAQAAQALGGHIDILVNNAGDLIGRVPITEMDDRHWHRVIDVNLSSTFYAVRAVFPYMNTGWGRIVNMSSVAGKDGGGQGAVAYAASKAGVIGLTRGLAKELAPRGITVNVLAPGIILHTAFHDKYTSEQAQQATIERTPVGRPGTPEDVAAAVLYFVSEHSGFVTGTVADMNGGIYMG